MTRIYLDTHVAIWIGQKKLAKLSKKALAAIEKSTFIHLPAMVELELQVLSEIGKIKVLPEDIINSLADVLTLQLSTQLFYDVCHTAKAVSWTRDLFDRLIVAEAICAGNAPLITADTNIHAHYKKALW